MAFIISKYQNIQTKYADMQNKKQLKAMCVSEKPLYKASNTMCWIKTNINWPTNYPTSPHEVTVLTDIAVSFKM